MTATIVSTVLAAFLASFVEVVEASTIVLAVGLTRGWRPAVIGTGVGLLLLLILVLVFGPLLALIPIWFCRGAVPYVTSSGSGGKANNGPERRQSPANTYCPTGRHQPKSNGLIRLCHALAAQGNTALDRGDRAA